jgi:hypothetical protein
MVCPIICGITFPPKAHALPHFESSENASDHSGIESGERFRRINNGYRHRARKRPRQEGRTAELAKGARGAIDGVRRDVEILIRHIGERLSIGRKTTTSRHQNPSKNRDQIIKMSCHVSCLTSKRGCSDEEASKALVDLAVLVIGEGQQDWNDSHFRSADSRFMFCMDSSKDTCKALGENASELSTSCLSAFRASRRAPGMIL